MSNKKTNIGLIEYCRLQIGKPYWYGTFGQTSSQTLYEQKKRQYPKYYTASDFDELFGQRVHDCIGLIKGYMWSDTPDSKPVYNSQNFKDLTADQYYKKCTHKGTISTMPLIQGVAVFMPGHVGIYIGDGKVIEARGHKYGVVVTRLTERNWTKWAYIDEIEYI